MKNLLKVMMKTMTTILEVNIEYPKCLFDLWSDLTFLPEGIKIKKCQKLICNLHHEYVVHIRT